MDKETKFVVRISVSVIIFIILLVMIAMYGLPQYHVYSQKMDGEAALKKAESERMVQIQDAKGKEEAAKMLAQAEIERAKGVAEANRIIGHSLKDNPDYLTWLWIEQLKADGNHTVIYIPTEAGLPIVEAGRGFGRPAQKK